MQSCGLRERRKTAGQPQIENLLKLVQFLLLFYNPHILAPLFGLFFQRLFIPISQDGNPGQPLRPGAVNPLIYPSPSARMEN